MAVTVGPITAVRLVAGDAEQLAAFYADAFGFVAAPASPDDPAAVAQAFGLRGGQVQTRALRLGRQTLELLTVVPAGRPYPSGTGSADTVFQHIALVVSDMAAAMARLNAVRGWTPISTDGPEHLPVSSGGVTAFKFRDPEGHPLEFLAFPADNAPPAWQASQIGPCLGFDHSAIAVSDTAASLAFYGRLGLARDSGSLNQGPEQSRMDAVPDAVVEVAGLGVPGAPPHLELLCYRNGTTRTQTAVNDVAATQVAFAVADRATLVALADGPATDLGNGRCAALLRDPDGHRLWLHAPAT